MSRPMQSLEDFARLRTDLMRAVFDKTDQWEKLPSEDRACDALDRQITSMHRRMANIDGILGDMAPTTTADAIALVGYALDEARTAIDGTDENLCPEFARMGHVSSALYAALKVLAPLADATPGDFSQHCIRPIDSLTGDQQEAPEYAIRLEAAS